MVVFLKGDRTAEITLALAQGFDYSGKTVHLEYQGVRRSFPSPVAGGTVSFSFSAAETAPMSLGAYPVRVWLEDAQGEKTTIHNSAVKFRVTNCATDLHAESAIYLDVRGGLYGIDGLPPRFTENDLRGKINEILRRLGGTVAMLLLCALPAFAASLTVETAPKGEIYNDEAIVTNVTLDVSDLATASNLDAANAAIAANAADIAANADAIAVNAASIATNSARIATKADAIKYVGTNSYELADCDWVCDWDGATLESGDGEAWRFYDEGGLGRALVSGSAFGRFGTFYLEYETVGTNTVRTVYYLPILPPSMRADAPNPEEELWLDNYNALVFNKLTDGTDAPETRRLVRTEHGWNLEYPVVYKDSLDALAKRTTSELATKANAEQVSVVTNAAEWRVNNGLYLVDNVPLVPYEPEGDFWNDTYYMRKVNMWRANGPPTKLWVWDSGEQYFRLGWYDPEANPYGVHGYLAEWHFNGGYTYYNTAPSAEDEGLLGFGDNTTVRWVVESEVVTNTVAYTDTTAALSSRVSSVAADLAQSVANLESKKAEKYIFEIGDTWVSDDTGDVYTLLPNTRVWTNETTQASITWTDNYIPSEISDIGWVFNLPSDGTTPPELFTVAYGYTDDDHVTFYNSDDPATATDIRQFSRQYPVTTNVVNYIRIEYDATDGRPSATDV